MLSDAFPPLWTKLWDMRFSVCKLSVSELASGGAVRLVEVPVLVLLLFRLRPSASLWCTPVGVVGRWGGIIF